MSNPQKKSTSPGKRKRGRRDALAVGAYLPGVARAAFEAHGFPTAAVLSDWPEIIGPEFAGITAPERLIWPRGAELQGAEDTGAKTRASRRRKGATLVLRVEGPRALEVQHMATQLIERVNTYFGYHAVSELRLVQGPVHREKKPAAPPPAKPGAEPEIEKAIEDTGLRAALSRLRATLER